jgi:lycopene beta-cyclase
MGQPLGESFDYLLVGGGLGNALIALSLFEAQPGARVGLVEQGATLGGDHIWCFHAGDVQGAAREVVSRLVGASWPRYDVRFPERERTLEEPYCAVRSERLDEVVQAAFAERPSSRLFLRTRAVSVTDRSVTLDDGRELRAAIVIESRGPDALAAGDGAGYQKFLGLELKLSRPSPISHPLLMDARLAQRDGFRFVYALPFASDRVLLEDTYFSDSRDLNREHVKAEILGYAAAHGFEVTAIVREELGILPLPTRLPQLANPAPGGPLVAGYQGAWFHPVTGYSFPVAARLASAVATTDPKRLREQVWPALLREQRSQLRFCLLLNRMFFGAFAPDARRNVIERFYGLPTPTVRRFYAMTLTHADRARILCGRPPRGFSLARALSGAGRRSAPPSLGSTSGGAVG